MDDLSITVAIADRQFKLRIKRDEEEFFRQAVGNIERQLNEYSQLYAYKDKQDLLSMVLLQYATDLLRTKAQQVHSEKEWMETLSKLDRVLSDIDEIAP